ncbi:probable ATP-dependent RNA helicase Dbp73D [Battus philenor]|uniref:probable ATP-dependent RNA helicase Dbp73D n=1 Tax=Battus philenor TaxID=42288 RepID=UPI0035CEE6B4
MDLFIINRYKGENIDDNFIERETQHLQRLKERIEERKKSHNTQKVSKVITLKEDLNKDADFNETPKNPLVNDKRDENNTEGDDQITLNKGNNTTTEKRNEFKVLGLNDFEQKSKVQRVLPHWLSHPFSISKNLQNLNSKVEDQVWLNNILKTTLLNEGITHLFPVQEKVIPFILNEHKLSYPLWPHDICVSAPTGSGKTLTFVLPIIQVLLNQIGHYIRALIVLPVQELAIQVAKVCKKFCTNTGLQVALLSGSTPFHQEQQNLMKYTESSGWVSEVDIIVCTAGRLVEHLQNTEGFSLNHLKFLVIDEADRIMDNIQNDWLYHMERHIRLGSNTTNKIPHLNWSSINDQKAFPHKLLFSATLSPDPELLEQWGLFQPKLFSATPVSIVEGENNSKTYVTPDELIEKYVVCGAEEKPLILFHLLVEKKWDKVLCFTNSAQSAHRLTVLLNEWGKHSQLKAVELSSALDRSSREKVLKKFTNSEVNVILSTDALARGIDIPECNYVISYDPPRNIKTYIHRVGRTGRAGKIGNAVTILLHNQLNMFKDMLNCNKKNEISQLLVSEESYSHLIQSYENAIHETKEIIHNEIKNKVQKSIELKRGTRKNTRKRKHNEENNI